MYTIFEYFHNGVDFNVPVQEIVPLLVKYGIGGISPSETLISDEVAAKEAAKCVYDNGLKWGLCPFPIDFYSESVSDEEFEDGLETMKRWASVSEKIGCQYAYNFVRNGSDYREYDAQFEWILIRLKRVWKVMDDHGIKYGLEFLGPHPMRNSFKYPFFNTLSGILALADAVDPKCGFLFDCYHWYLGSDANYGDLYLAAKHCDRMVNFHLNDGIAGKTREQQEDQYRALPLTTGVVDASVPYKLFKEHGYTGPMMCEPVWPWIDDCKKRPLEENIRILADTYCRVESAALERSN